MIDKAQERKVRFWLALAIVIVVAVFALFFFQFTDNLGAEFVFSQPDENGYVAVMGYSGNPRTLRIPDKDDEGHEVRYIDKNAFGSNYSKIRKVVIPDTVVSIGENAFSDMPKLKKVVFSENLETIGRSAFARCTKLKTVDFPNTLRMIDDEAFYGCLRLSRVYVPASVTDIGMDAFFACENLVLDVSDNPIAAEMALAYSIETGKVDKTAVYVVVALTVSMLVIITAVYILHHFHTKAKRNLAKKREAQEIKNDETSLN